jgi:chemotaxis signal transduction protein
MIPLHLAFKEKKSKLVKGMNPEILAGLMSKADSFSEELKQIVLQTEQINHSLKQIVFNGQILAHDDGHNDEYSRLKPLLNTIGRIGVNTSQLFGQSIKNLFATVISTSLDSAGFLASLAVDIMDRNLYERSDDCRWWALNPLFRGILSKDRLEEEDQRLLTKVLGYINRLYTVYSNLVLFDKTGTIVAVSNPEREGDIGISLSGEYIHQLLGNSNPERYFVSPFEKTELYDNRHTYIYGASITDSSGPSRIVGGIGIIFDSEFELHGMLKDAIETKKNAYAVFTDRSKKIISTTNPDLKIGNKLQLPAEFFELANGVSRSDVLAIDGAYYAVGCACSSSYRGYKNKDGYRNDVLAFVFERLAETNGENTAVIQNFGVSQSEVTLSQQQAHVKMATFRLDCHTFAVERSAALEAVDSQAVIYVPGMNDVIRGAVLYNNRFISVINTRMLLGIEDRGETPTQILILQLSDEIRVALEVDELSNILEVNESDIKSVPRIGRVASIVKGIYCIHNEAKRSVLMMNHDVLLEKINSTISKEELERALEYAKELSEEEKFIR